MFSLVDSRRIRRYPFGGGGLELAKLNLEVTRFKRGTKIYSSYVAVTLVLGVPVLQRVGDFMHPRPTSQPRAVSLTCPVYFACLVWVFLGKTLIKTSNIFRHCPDSTQWLVVDAKFSLRIHPENFPREKSREKSREISQAVAVRVRGFLLVFVVKRTYFNQVM